MPGLGTLLSGAGSAGEQLLIWGFLQGVIASATQPFLRDLAYQVNDLQPNVLLSPADLADAVVRGLRTQATAAAEAHSSGVDATRFATLVHLAGNPPGLEAILQWYRRGIIPWGEIGPTKATVANAIATSRVYTYWATAIKRANIVPIPPAEMVDALVEAQTTKGTRARVEEAANGGTATPAWAAATTFYEVMWANGYTPTQADLMFHTRGNPPAPTELLELFRRGLIAWTGTGQTATTVQQGIYEGATKDKWFPLFKGLVREIPSLYYIKQMVATGTIDRTTAISLMQAYGYTTAVVRGVVGAGEATQVATYKKLTESVITTLYKEQQITKTQCTSYLEGIGYGKTAAEFVVTAIELTRSYKATQAAISKVGTYFNARKITRSTALEALKVLGVTGAAATTLLNTWTLEQALNVKLPSASDYTDNVKYGVISVTEGLQGLVNLGYTPYDAWLVMSAALHAKAGTPPAQGPGPTFPVTVP